MKLAHPVVMDLKNSLVRRKLVACYNLKFISSSLILQKLLLYASADVEPCDSVSLFI